MMDLKGTIYWSIYGDVFALMKELLPVQQSGSYWDYAIDKAQCLCRKYEQTEGESFAREQAMSVVNEIERLGKKEEQKK